jgi:hypothetical protein
MRKVIVVLGIVVGSLAIPATAWAHNCVNVSRKPGSEAFEQKGKWFYIPPSAEMPLADGAWGFDTPQGFGGESGHGHVLLDGTGACNTARLSGQTQGTFNPNAAKGIWSGDCFDAAVPAP